MEGYIDELEATLIQDLTRSFAAETWMPVRYICDDIMVMSLINICSIYTKSIYSCLYISVYIFNNANCPFTCMTFAVPVITVWLLMGQ